MFKMHCYDKPEHPDAFTLMHCYDKPEHPDAYGYRC